MTIRCSLCGNTFNNKSQATCARCRGSDPLGKAATKLTRGSVDQSKLGERFNSPSYNATGGDISGGDPPLI